MSEKFSVNSASRSSDTQGIKRSRFRRALIKVSGELFSGTEGTKANHKNINEFVDVISQCRDIGLQIALVVGGGNFWRGAQHSGEHLSRSVADRIGMLATVMNGLLLADALSRVGLRNRLYCAFELAGFAQVLDPARAEVAMEDGEIILLTGGIGMPMFTTDTGAVMRAAELNCDVVLKGTQVDGVYDFDPRSEHGKEACRFSTITCSELLQKNLRIIDHTAATLAKEAKIPIEVFSIHPPQQLFEVVVGNISGSVIQPS